MDFASSGILRGFCYCLVFLLKKSSSESSDRISSSLMFVVLYYIFFFCICLICLMLGTSSWSSPFSSELLAYTLCLFSSLVLMVFLDFLATLPFIIYCGWLFSLRPSSSSSASSQTVFLFLFRFFGWFAFMLIDRGGWVGQLIIIKRRFYNVFFIKRKARFLIEDEQMRWLT